MAGLQGSSTSSRALRSTTRANNSSQPGKAYIGLPQPNLPEGKLPSLRDILKVQAWLRQQPGCSKKAIPSFCCNVTATRESICDKEGGCVSLGKCSKTPITAFCRDGGTHPPLPSSEQAAGQKINGKKITAKGGTPPHHGKRLGIFSPKTAFFA